MTVPLHELLDLGQLQRLANEGRGLVGIRLLGVGEDLIELGADQLVPLDQRRRDRVHGELLLADETLRLLEEPLEHLVGEDEDRLRERSHRVPGRHHQGRAHAQPRDVSKRAVGGVLQVRARARELGVEDQLLHGTGAE